MPFFFFTIENSNVMLSVKCTHLNVYRKIRKLKNISYVLNFLPQPWHLFILDAPPGCYICFVRDSNNTLGPIWAVVRLMIPKCSLLDTLFNTFKQRANCIHPPRWLIYKLDSHDSKNQLTPPKIQTNQQLRQTRKQGKRTKNKIQMLKK